MLDRVKNLKEIAEPEMARENRIGGSEAFEESVMNAGEPAKGIELVSIVPDILGSQETLNIINRQSDVAGDEAFVNWERGGHQKFGDGRESESGAMSSIILREGRATRKIGRSHGRRTKRHAGERQRWGGKQ